MAATYRVSIEILNVESKLSATVELQGSCFKGASGMKADSNNGATFLKRGLGEYSIAKILTVCGEIHFELAVPSAGTSNCSKLYTWTSTRPQRVHIPVSYLSIVKFTSTMDKNGQNNLL